MRTLLLLAFTSISLLSFSQKPDSVKTTKWAVGLTYSPDFCYRTSYNKDNQSTYSNIEEKPKFGFTTGINLLYRFMDKIGIEFGVLYSTKGQKLNTESYKWINPDDLQDPTVPNYNASYAVVGANRKTKYTYQYVEVPLKVNVYLINKKLKVFPSVGCSVNIFAGKKTESVFDYEDGRHETEKSNYYNIKSNHTAEFAVLAGVGITYDITNKLFVKFEPSYRTFIRPLVDYPLSGTLYSLGANTGIYLNF